MRLPIYGALLVVLAAYSAQAETDPPPLNPAAVAQGEQLFTRNCVYCHGHQGSGGKAKSLQNREFEPEYLFKTISNGRRRGSLVMPPWKRSLSEEQRWHLVEYILSLGQIKNE